MNINKIDSSTNFKAKLVIDKRLASKLPGLENLKKIAEGVKSADFIRIRKAPDTRYLPKYDMYVVIAEKCAVVQPNTSMPKQNKHFFGLSTKLLDKKIAKEAIQLEILDSINVSLENLAKKIEVYKKEFPGAIQEDKNLFQKIKSLLKR